MAMTRVIITPGRESDLTPAAGARLSSTGANAGTWDGQALGPSLPPPASHILNLQDTSLHTAQATASCLQTSGAVGMLVLGVLLSTEGPSREGAGRSLLAESTWASVPSRLWVPCASGKGGAAFS